MCAEEKQTRVSRPFSLNPTGTLSRRVPAQFVCAVDTFIARVAPDAPRLPSSGARADMSEPLATVPLGWRMVTLIGVAQLLDLGGARQSLGALLKTLKRETCYMESNVIQRSCAIS
jgi:hypothetical protein